MNNRQKQKLVNLVVKSHNCKMLDNLSVINVIWVESETEKQLHEIVETLREFYLVDDKYLNIEFQHTKNQSRIRFNTGK